MNLSHFKTVFCNSRYALLKAYEKGLPKRAQILTTSPALLLDPPEGAHVQNLEDRLSREKAKAAMEVCSAAAHVLWERLCAEAIDRFIAIAAARVLINYSGLFYHALLLRSEDFSEPCLLLTLKTGDTSKDYRYNGPWEKLLAGHPAFTCCAFQKVISCSECTVQSPPFWERLRGHSREYIEYRAWLLLWRHLPKWLARGVVGMGADNPLGWETAIHFARRGYALSALNDLYHKTAGSVPFLDTLKAVAQKVMTDFYKPYLALEVFGPVIEITLKEMLLQLQHFQNELASWECVFSNRRFGHFKYILSNMPKPALCKAAHQNAIKVVGFQHGVSREIWSGTPHFLINKEEAVSDLTIAYNPKAVSIINQNPFFMGQAYAAGVSKDYFISRKKPVKKAMLDLLYVSTTLLSDYSRASIFRKTWTDFKKIEFEKNLIEHVFSELPHRVYLKSYPAKQAYPDTNYFSRIIKAYHNVDYYPKPYLLRYIASQARILITSRATSTLAWCLMAKRPLVFLDIDDYTLYDDVREELKQVLFYFDFRGLENYSELKDFLSQPLEAIEQAWHAMQEKREIFIEHTIAAPGYGAGQRAARFIRQTGQVA